MIELINGLLITVLYVSFVSVCVVSLVYFMLSLGKVKDFRHGR